MRRVGRRWWIVLVAAALFVVLPAVYAGGLWMHLHRMHIRLPGSSAGTTFLLVGSDSRAEVSSAADRIRYGDGTTAPGNQADLILLVHIAADSGHVEMIALPRDLVVTTPAGNLTRLGPVLDDGMQVFVDTLCRNLGLGVDHVAEVHLIAFTHVVDAVGGVDVNLPDTIRDTFLHVTFAAGPHHFDGRTALTYIRARHVEVLRNGKWVAEAESALDRGKRAREVLTQVGHRIPSWSNPFALARVAWTMSKSVSVDDKTGLGDLRELEKVVGGIGHADETEVPVDFQPGDVPVAWLTPAGKTALSEFTGGSAQGHCINANVPLSGKSISPRAVGG
jgi:LCP family protein required for cell wall assembly